MAERLSFKNIRIPEPCHEDWNKMTPEEKGRRCAVCQKKVYDFTRSTEEEFKELRQLENVECIIIRQDQIYQPKEKVWWTDFRKAVASAGMIMAFEFFSAQSLLAQGSSVSGKSVVVEQPDLQEKRVLMANQVLKGKVMVENTDEALTIFLVQIHDAEGNSVGEVYTNNEGEFEFPIPDTLDVSAGLKLVTEKTKRFTESEGKKSYRYVYPSKEQFVTAEELRGDITLFIARKRRRYIELPSLRYRGTVCGTYTVLDRPKKSF